MKRFNHFSMKSFSYWNEIDPTSWEGDDEDYWNFSTMLEVCPLFGGHFERDINHYLFR